MLKLHMSPEIPWDTLQAALEALGKAVLTTFLELHRSQSTGVLASVHTETAADTIYAIDQGIEDRIVEWLDAHWDATYPVALIMEGLEEPLTLPRTTTADPAITLIIDPIDGTREIMWDRRSAWFLAALAPSAPGEVPHLQDVAAAVMVELPTTLQRGSFLASTGPTRRPRAIFFDIATEETTPVSLTPHPDGELAHGFISIGTPFYQGKARISRFAEAFIARYFEKPLHRLPIFDDQYISAGGQFFDVMTGRLRLVADLRPLFLDAPDGDTPLCAHPYDLCTAAVAQAFGCVIESPDGTPLNPPLDTTTPVAWMAYANEHIAARARPIVRRLLPMLSEKD